MAEADAAGSNSDDTQADSWTLERRFDPFQSFIKKIEVLMRVDPAEAKRLLELSNNAGRFKEPQQTAALEDKLVLASRKLETPEEYLRRVFGKNAPVPVTENGLTTAPAAVAAAPAYRAAPAPAAPSPFSL